MPAPPPPGPGPTASPSGSQRLVFRLENSGGVVLSNAELQIERQPGRMLTIPLRDDGMSPLDQPADGVLVGVDSGPYVRLVRGRLWVDQPAGRKLVWEGVLSVPDRDSDGASWALMNQQGQLVARPMVSFPAGDSVAGLVGGYPLAGVTAWGLLLLAYVGVLVLLSRHRPG